MGVATGVEVFFNTRFSAQKQLFLSSKWCRNSVFYHYIRPVSSFAP
jgi:hypothetical protein